MKVEIYLDDMLRNLQCRHGKELADAKLINSEYGLYHFKGSPKGLFVPVYIWRYKGKNGTISLVLNLTTLASGCYNVYLRLKADIVDRFGEYHYENSILNLTVPLFEILGVQQLNYIIKNNPYCPDCETAQLIWRLQMWNEPMMYQQAEPQVKAMRCNGCLGLGYGYMPGAGQDGWFMCVTRYGCGNGFIHCPFDDVIQSPLKEIGLLLDRPTGVYYEFDGISFKNPRSAKNISLKTAKDSWGTYLLGLKNTKNKLFKQISCYEHPIAMYFDSEPCWILGVDEKKVYFIYAKKFQKVVAISRFYLGRMAVALPKDKNFTY